jgi:hypothetical protein
MHARTTFKIPFVFVLTVVSVLDSVLMPAQGGAELKFTKSSKRPIRTSMSPPNIPRKATTTKSSLAWPPAMPPTSFCGGITPSWFPKAASRI